MGHLRDYTRQLPQIQPTNHITLLALALASTQPQLTTWTWHEHQLILSVMLCYTHSFKQTTISSYIFTVSDILQRLQFLTSNTSFHPRGQWDLILECPCFLYLFANYYYPSACFSPIWMFGITFTPVHKFPGNNQTIHRQRQCPIRGTCHFIGQDQAEISDIRWLVNILLKL